MLVRILAMINNAREALLATFIGSVAYKNAYGDSQHGIFHHVGEWSEVGHILLTVAMMAVGLGCFGFSVWKNRKALLAPWKKCWRDFRKTFH